MTGENADTFSLTISHRGRGDFKRIDPSIIGLKLREKGPGFPENGTR
jgi:hypothetical protein